MNKPIPAFYACYLLRSTVRHASLYVGSTPNPARRLRQHNGDTKGGAARTSRDSLRPWEMTCLVTGFPSKVAALQFEWAWQNTHLTRHISPNTRMTQSRATVRISPKTGRARKRAARPRLSLTDRLANLHLLLRASSFSRWPLNVTFYSEDVFRVWQKWMEQGVEPLRDGIAVTLDGSSPGLNGIVEATSGALSGVQAIDVGYDSLKPHLEKASGLLAAGSRCAVCSKRLPSSGAMTLICPSTTCHMAGHLSCLAPSFSRLSENLVPTTGHCPGCGAKLHWINLVKELSLRMRGEAEVQKIFKVRKPRGTKKGDPAMAAIPVAEAASEDEEMAEDDIPYLSVSDDSEIDDTEPAASAHAIAKHGGSHASKLAPSTDLFIEDSDWDDAEIVT